MEVALIVIAFLFAGDRVFSDIAAAARGQTPPSHERWRERMARKPPRRRRQQHRLPRVRAYLGAVGDHALESALTSRQTKWQAKADKLGPVRGERYAQRYQRVAERMQARLDGTYRSPIRRAAGKTARGVRAVHERARRAARGAVFDAVDAATSEQRAADGAAAVDGEPIPARDTSVAAEPASVGDAAAEAPAGVTRAGAPAATGPTTTTRIEGGQRVEVTEYPDGSEVGIYPDNLARAAAQQRGWREVPTPDGETWTRDMGGSRMTVRELPAGGYEWSITAPDQTTATGTAGNLDDAFEEAEVAEHRAFGDALRDALIGRRGGTDDADDAIDAEPAKEVVDCGLDYCDGHYDHTEPPTCGHCGDGVMAQTGRVYHGVEGEVLADTKCTGCGIESYARESWDPPASWTEPGPDDPDAGNGGWGDPPDTGPTTNGTSNHEGERTMTAIQSDVAGVDEAIAACDQYRQDNENMPATFEALRATLNDQGVGPDGLAILARMEERATEDATDAGRLHDILMESKQVGEAYAANPNAGRRSFATNGALPD